MRMKGLSLSRLLIVAVLSACDGPGQETELGAPMVHPATPVASAPPPPQPAAVDTPVRQTAADGASAPFPEAVGWRGPRQRDRTVRDFMLLAEPAVGGDWMRFQTLDRENYAGFEDNAPRLVREHPVSTFSIDVDTGAYGNVRRMLNEGRLPPAAAVRAEEMINYFSYDYAAPEDPASPFAIHTELAPSPWNAGRHLLQVGLRGYAPPVGERPAANLVFLVDVSGSMQGPRKLALLRSSLKLLAGQLRDDDRVSLVTYAGTSAVLLRGAGGGERGVIEAALDGLHAGGGTNGGAGIQTAYDLARQAFIEGGINRVILATDGDFNVGLTDIDALLDLIRAQRRGGVTLTTLGFGAGNYNDHLMERLAAAGNGNHAYIDTLGEARKVLVEELGATLQVIASDVKIQLEFNPAVVSEYRLVGYENRQLRREDFNNDRVDAGEIGAGHSVTALYEIVLAGSGATAVDPLRYQATRPASSDADELGYLKLRYKLPGEDVSRLLEQAIAAATATRTLAQSSEDLRFAAAVAGFAQLLRGGTALGDFDYDQVLALAAGARGIDPFGHRAEFLNLVRTARLLSCLSSLNGAPCAAEGV